jgi:multidrug efflux pump subunit AcrB
VGVVAFFTKRPVLVYLFFLVFLIWGLFKIREAPVDVYPDLPLYEVTITTVWPGAGAEEVERLITDPLEQEVKEIADISRLASWSRAGLSIIDVKFVETLSEEEMRERLADVRAKIDQADELPADAEQPIVAYLTIDEVWPVIYVGVLDDQGNREHLLRAVSKRLERRLELLPGVRRVDPFFQRDRWLIAEIRRQALDRHELTLSEVVDAVAAEAEDAPAGDLRREGQATTRSTAVSAAGAIEGPESLGERVVQRLPEGGHVRLEDVAEIEDGFEDQRVLVRLNGRPAAVLGVVKQHSANALEVVDELRAELAHFEREELPPGLSVTTSIDSTQIVRSRLGVLGFNLAQGIFLVFLTLMFALGARPAILAIIGIPFSFIAAFTVLGAMGVTINALTLFSMVLVAGMVVDDAIIVLENIHRHFERGKRGVKAVVEAVGEVFWPVIAAVTTTVAAFLPLLFMQGVMGMFFKIIPQTVIAVLVASLVESLFILPGHFLDFGMGRRALEGEKPRTRFGVMRERIEAFQRFIARWLALRVERLVARRWVVIGFAFALLLACFGLAAHLKVMLFPSDFQIFIITATSPPGSNLEQTSELMSEIESTLRPRLGDSLLSFLTMVGYGYTPDNTIEVEPVVGQILVELTDKGAKDPDAVMGEIRDEVQSHLADHPDIPCESLVLSSPNDGPPIGKAVAVQVLCGNYDEGRAVAERVRSALSGMEGVKDIGVNLRTGLRRAELVMNEPRAAALNLTFAQVARELQLANFGAKVGRWFDPGEGERVDVWLRLAADDRDTLADLAQVPLRTPAGARIQLQDVADFHVANELATRYRRGGKRCILVTAEADNVNATSYDINQRLRARTDEFTRGYPGVTLSFSGEFEETEKSFASLGKSFLVAFLLIFTILAVQFNSAIQPLIVACAIPFATAGVVLGMWLFGFPFTYPTGVALVGLAGVVVNDSLILVDFINRERAASGSLASAVSGGVQMRFRPIMLTSLTTIGGLLPMALGTGGYSVIWSPFAAALIFGMISSTLLNLLIVPCLYVAAEDVRAVLARLRPRHGESHEWPGAVQD